MRGVRLLLSLVMVVVVAGARRGAAADVPYRGHGVAMHGDLKYGADFTHFDYVNPQAPKGGEVTLYDLGTFDSFNPFIIRGNPAAGIGNLTESLLTAAADEPFSEYGLLAERVEMPADRSSVTFTLNAKARWHDGVPVGADDVIWSFETLRDKGQPYFRAYYAGVDRVEKVDPRTVRFHFKGTDNRELPLIVGQLPVLPKHYWEKRDFERTMLEVPVGSGPYTIKSFEAGRNVVYERVADYWGANLPVNVGRYNFGTIRYEYYRDNNVATEAFKAGEYDFRLENASKTWATQYDIAALKDGQLVKKNFAHKRPAGMQGFAYNARRALFRDRKVRQALAYAFDFEWSNKNLFYGQYTRSRSYFDNSELAATGLPSPAELQLLEPYRGRVPDEVFTAQYDPPSSDGSGRIRDNLRQAVKILAEAGWQVDAATKKLSRSADGKIERFAFEILLVDPQFERIALPFVKNLERLGIDATVRTVDSAQYKKRIDEFDFDMIVMAWNQSLSPGNEQRAYWGSDAAARPGSFNVAGIADPVVDALVEKLIAAPDRAALVAATRALDRVLQWGFWVIPNWYIGYDRVLYWQKFGMPSVVPDQGVQFDTWWVDAEKASRLPRRSGATGAGE